MPTLFSIPLEVRLLIYALVLANHRENIVFNTQPSNAHIRFLHTCKQVEHEAGLLAGFRTYLSLRYEREIAAFLDYADGHVVSQITHLDVANDGRLVQHPKTDQRTPVSRLHRALDNLPSLVSLRVFDCHRVRSLHEFVSGTRFVWSFENAMFPQKRHGISSYEFFISSTSKAVVLHSVSGENVRRLRLSGFLRLDQPLESCKMLQHLTIYGVNGNYFDQRPLTGMEHISLQSLQYRQENSLGFEITAPFLISILSGSHSSLRRLVLLQCGRLTTAGLVTSLLSLTSLECFSLSFITVNELDQDFIAALPSSTRTMKLKITEARYSRILLSEEQILCESIKAWIENPATSKRLQLHLPHVINRSTREEEWKTLALQNRTQLQFGDWEANEVM